MKYGAKTLRRQCEGGGQAIDNLAEKTVRDGDRRNGRTRKNVAVNKAKNATGADSDSRKRSQGENEKGTGCIQAKSKEGHCGYYGRDGELTAER